MGKYNRYNNDLHHYRSNNENANSDIEESLTKSETSEEEAILEDPIKIQNKKESIDDVGSADSTKKVCVTVDNLNIRKGPGKNFDLIGEFTGSGIFEISECKDGNGSNKGWGKLSNGKGWISLDFCEEIK